MHKTLAVVLIGGVMAYEFMKSKPSAPVRGTSAARAQSVTRQPVSTGAAGVTSALSSAEKLANGFFSLFKPSVSPSRPSQSGFTQPSNQSMNTVQSPSGDTTVTYNNDGTITINGQMYNQDGTPVEVGPMLPPDWQVQQSAPGDGSPQSIFDQQWFNDYIGGVPEGNQDAALAADANQQSFVPDDWETDPSFWG